MTKREKELDLLARDLEMLLMRLLRGLDRLRAGGNWSPMNILQCKAEDFLARKGRASPLKKNK